MKKAQTNESGSAVIIALFVILVIAAFVGIAVTLTSGTLQRTDSSRDFAALRASAEGSLDFAYGVWTKTINSYYRPVTRKELAAKMAQIPSFGDFDYTPVSEDGPLQINPVNEYGAPTANATATPAPSKVTLDNYPGCVATTLAILPVSASAGISLRNGS